MRRVNSTGMFCINTFNFYDAVSSLVEHWHPEVKDTQLRRFDSVTASPISGFMPDGKERCENTRPVLWQDSGLVIHGYHFHRTK